MDSCARGSKIKQTYVDVLKISVVLLPQQLSFRNPIFFR